MKVENMSDEQKMKLIRLYHKLKNAKTDYMLHKPWFCVICNNNKDYTLAGKHMHLRTKKHYKNAFTYNTGYIHDEKENT